VSEGFYRIKQILGILPVSRRTWWRGVKSGKYPKPLKLSKNVTAWRVSEIEQLLDNLDRPGAKTPPKPRHRVISEGIRI